MDNDKMAKQLVLHEGLKLEPYTDTVGKITIGVGHNLTDRGITYKQAINILQDDMADVDKFLEANCPWYKDLDDIRQRVIFDMAFVMMGKLLDFKSMIVAIKVKAWDAAANQILNSKFGEQTGRRAQNLAKMMRSGQEL